MIEGHVNDALEPVVEIGLKRGAEMTTIVAVVDTGFSGDLCLAELHIDRIDLIFAFAEPYELADGKIVVQDVFLGRVVFDGHEQEVEILLTSSEDTLIGASLLREYILSIDYPGRVVRIERAAGGFGTGA